MRDKLQFFPDDVNRVYSCSSLRSLLYDMYVLVLVLPGMCGHLHEYNLFVVDVQAVKHVYCGFFFVFLNNAVALFKEKTEEVSVEKEVVVWIVKRYNI